MLAPLAEAGAYDREECRRRRPRDRFRQQIQPQDRAIDLGRGAKGAGRHPAHQPRARIILHAHRQQREVAGCGADALCDLQLHEYDRETGRRRCFEQVTQHCAGDVVGQVGHHFVDGRRVLLRHQRGGVKAQNVAVDNRHVRRAGKACTQRLDQAIVQFHGDNAGRLRCQRLGQHALAWADFQHPVCGRQVGRGDDARQVDTVDEEVLAEGLLWMEVSRHRQMVNRQKQVRKPYMYFCQQV